MDILWTPATELRDLIRRRELSPVELLDAVLRRVEVLNPTLNAFLTLDADRARDAAKKAEASEPRGLLHGLPVSIKDLEQTAGLRTTMGSKFFEHFVPDQDGAMVERLRTEGAIVFGKTNTPHFGHKDMCDNLLGPPCRNPWKLDRTSGASSGGAGAATAAGMGPLAHGSDGAGSIRIPASLCGIFGMKPSFGRVPYWPNNDFWAARSHNGPMTRTVRDGALLLTAMAGPDPRDPATIDAPREDYLAACEGGIKGLRVAWSVDFGYAPVDPEVRRITTAAAKRFEELGCRVEEVTPPWEDPAPWAERLWYHTYAYRHDERARQHPEWIEPSMMEMIEGGRRLTALEIGQAMMARSAFYEQARRFLEPYDLLLTPQMPCTAWSVERWPAEIEGRPTPTMFSHLPFTFPFNLTGWPAATVPCGFDAEGLPVGLQIVAGWHQDAPVLRAAAAFEEIQPWAQHRPPV